MVEPLKFRCPLTWDALAPTADPARRYCDVCAEVVTDLSALTEAEARALRASPPSGSGRSRCVRRLRGADGAIVYADTPRPGDACPARWPLARLARASLVPLTALAVGCAARRDPEIGVITLAKAGDPEAWEDAVAAPAKQRAKAKAEGERRHDHVDDEMGDEG